MLRAALPCFAGTLLLAQALPKPTPHHEALKAAVGTWDAVVKMHTAPGQPPLESKGVEVNTLVLGGFWLSSEATFKMGDMTFEGCGLFGYDPFAKKHVGTWMDNSGPWAAITTGTCTEGCKEVTSTFEGYTEAGKPASFKQISRQVDGDHRTMAMFHKRADGTWLCNMEVSYTRRK